MEAEVARTQRELILLGISGLCLAVSLTGWVQRRFGFDPAWGAILINGVPLLTFALRGLIIRRDVTAGVLVSIALVAAIAIKEYFAAGEVAFIMAVGELLENMTVAKAGSALRKLARLAPSTACVLRNGRECRVPAAELKVGEHVVVRPGEIIPVDGIVVNGESTVNQAAVTGEAMPVDKRPGSEVFIGTTNLLGALEIQATRVGKDTTLAKIIDLVRRAQTEKAPIVRIADRLARLLVPVMLAVAVIVGVVTKDVVRAVTILVVFCPCALVLSVPTALIAGIGNAARRGIIIKGGAVCEQLARIDTVLFDKTGTLTQGRPEVYEVVGFSGVSPEEVLRLASSVERLSEHPIGQAIVSRSWSEGIEAVPVESFQVVLGRGAKGTVLSELVGVGNAPFIESLGLQLDPVAEAWQLHQQQQGRSTLFVVQGDKVIGGITVADRPRPEAGEAIRALREAGVSHVEMITGDSGAAASAVAKELGLTGFQAELLPGDKAEVVKRLKAQGRFIAMVGDGINDAPALAVSDVGIAMGVAGTDVAVETAGLTLMTEDLRKVPEAIWLSRRVKAVITQNLWASAVINLTAIILASGGRMGPVMGALWHNAGSVAVVINSARLTSLETSLRQARPAEETHQGRPQ
ncbi:MAG: heavy metal translocating P-type ATPase [Betaproteobacteria bacterium]